MFGMYVVDQNGRVLTTKYIEVEPYPWLEKLKKSALYSSWWGRIGQALTQYGETELVNKYDIIRI